MVRRLSDREVARLLETHSAGTSPGFLLWHATLRWQRGATAALRTEGLTHVAFSILGTVWWFERTGRTPSQREVSEHAGLDPVMLSQVVRQLERDGLVLRTVDAEDTRVKRVTVTAEGRRVAERSVALMDAVDRTFFEAAGPIGDVVAVLAPLARRGAAGEPLA